MSNGFLKRRAVGIAAAMAAASAGAIAAAPAGAATTSGCAADASSSQIFSSWGDTNDYRLFPGGDFDTSGTTWSLSNGASVSSAADPLGISQSATSGVLTLPPGASATSPMTCVAANDPTARFMQTAAGSWPGQLVVQFIAWQPSAILNDGSAFTQYVPGSTSMSVRLTARFGSVSVDDVYLDPRGRW